MAEKNADIPAEVVTIPESVRLYDYLPLFMKSFQEIRENYKGVQHEIDEIYNKIAWAMNNAYIETADEWGIGKFENLLGILPEEGEDLEVRRARVKIRWNSYIPYTKITLRQKLDAICGAGMYQLVEDYENYYVSVRTQITSPTVLSEVEKMFEQLLPAEMVYEVGQLYNTHGKIKNYKHGELEAYTHGQIKEDMDL